jgi:hypothetical protein
MGAGTGSSGLHHDFHDNFYCLLAGRKQFRLYSPADCLRMAVAGEIETCHENGLISYRSNPVRSDGAPFSLLEGEPVRAEKRREEETDDEDEEELVLGKGFDYESDEEEKEGGDAAALVGDNMKDDYDEVVSEQENQTDGNEDSDGDRPDHFSWIDPTQDKSSIATTFPSFAKCRECIVAVQQGQCLYLPASWFHCVTSSCDEKEGKCSTADESENSNTRLSSGVHMAINYWYHPPDNLKYFESPYKDDFWKKRAISEDGLAE